jgi:hypothetical protein
LEQSKNYSPEKSIQESILRKQQGVKANGATGLDSGLDQDGTVQVENFRERLVDFLVYLLVNHSNLQNSQIKAEVAPYSNLLLLNMPDEYVPDPKIYNALQRYVEEPSGASPDEAVFEVSIVNLGIFQVFQ